MSGSPPLRPRRIRKAPQNYGVWDEGSDCGSVSNSVRGRARDRVCGLPDLVDSELNLQI